jgi:DNA-binding transcriptional LysR family regulator
MQASSMNLARFDLVSVRLAVLCAELGSLSAAAWRVHCSLSTASYRLSRLEESFGAQLFTRERDGLRATRTGGLFVQHGKAILEQVERMNRIVRAAEDAEDAVGGTA